MSAVPSSSAASLHPALDRQPLQMLVRIARQSRLGDPEGCAAVLSMLAASRLVRGHLQRLLSRLGLTEVKLHTLVTLYAFDPEPCTPADLAHHAQVSRAAMTDTLDALRSRGWILRERSRADRRTLLIQLTAGGRTLVEDSVRPFLTAIARCADALTAGERAALAGACAHLCDHFQTKSA